MVLLALLLDSLESGVPLFTTTILVIFPSRTTLVINSKVTGAFTSNVAIFQIKYFPSKVQFSGTTNSRPLVIVSLTTTSLAALGPLFTTVIVHLTVSLTNISVALTILVISKSQIGLA